MQKNIVVLCCILLFCGIHSGVCASKGASAITVAPTSSVVRIPSATKIAKDLVGCAFREKREDGYFTNVDWKITSADQVSSSIIKVNKRNDIYHYDVNITLTRPSRSCYILSCKIGYAYHNGEWVQDYFICNKIMPKITNQYKGFIKVVDRFVDIGTRRELVIRNYSNVKLVILGVVKYEENSDMRKFAVYVDPNDVTYIGDVFLGSVESYEIHYVERH